MVKSIREEINIAEWCGIIEGVLVFFRMEVRGSYIEEVIFEMRIKVWKRSSYIKFKVRRF